MLSCVTSVPIKIPILSHTSASYSEALYNVLGRGKQHAVLVYENFLRKGAVLHDHPAFKNCPMLLEEIISHTEWPDLNISNTRLEGETSKFLLKTIDNLEVESVLIPMQSGGTLCISSQVGCRMGCAFCETGRMGLLRNLSAEEIIGQVFAARHLLKFSFRNIVFMGMGEPFDNYDEVIKAVSLLMDPKGLGFGRKHVTISTSGCLDGIYRLAEAGADMPNLAVSINAPTDELRNKLMPVNRKHNMHDLYQAMFSYCQKTSRQILAAYVLIKDMNDSLEHADLLAEYLQNLDVKINLIPYNPQSRDRYQPSESSVIEAFAKRLRQKGYYTLLRLTKGRTIMAGCGQLGNLELRKKRAALPVLQSSDIIDII